MTNLDILREVLSWGAAATVTFVIAVLFIKGRAVRAIRGKAAADLAALGAGDVTEISYAQAVKSANAAASKWLGLAVIGLPATLFATYVLANGFGYVNGQLIGSILLVAATFAVLVGVFVAIREPILRHYTKGK